MSIERFHGFYTPVCDECEKTIPGGQSYGEAFRAMLRAGWEERQHRGVKTHVCTDCLFAQKEYGTGGDEACKGRTPNMERQIKIPYTGNGTR